MMKRLMIAIILLTVAAGPARGGDDFRRKHRSFSFSMTEMSDAGTGQTLRSNYGAAFTTTRTYFLHRKPIGGFLKIGIDATWFDLCYNNYKILYKEYGQTSKEYMHQAEIGMQAGLSLTFNPVGKMNITLYGRYAPTFSAYYHDGISGGYAGYWIGGGSLSYGVIGLGVEYRTGKCNYRHFSEGGSTPASMSGLRGYISLNF